MKKILFYIHSLNKGGAERVLLTLAKKLSEIYEVVILTDTFAEREYPLPEGIRRINLQEYMDKVSWIKDNRLKRLYGIRHCCKKEAPDKIIVFMISTVMRAIVANLFSPNKVIAAVRSNPYDDYGTGKKRIILHIIFSFAEKIVCQTSYQKEYFNKQLQKKIVVIANPLYEEFCIEPYIGEKEKQIVSVGRLYDWKNQKLLIHAFAKIAERFPQYQVIIYGEGPYRNELEAEIQRFNMETRIFLPGDSSHVAMDIYKASVFVLTSDTEGMPNALMEAMALGLAVISTDCPCGGPKSLIQHGENGLLCRVGDLEEMTEQLTKVLEDEGLRTKLGTNALSIREKCHIDRISQMWSQLIEEE